MKLTVANLVEGRDALRNFLNSSEMPIQLAFRLEQAVPSLDSELRRIEKYNNELAQKYGEKKEDGTLTVTPGSEEHKKFFDERAALLAEHVELDMQPVRKEELMNTNIKISPVELSILKKIGVII